VGLTKYMFDFYEGGSGILLLKGDESKEMLISKNKFQGAGEGDILLFRFGKGKEIKGVRNLEEERKMTKGTIGDS